MKNSPLKKYNFLRAINLEMKIIDTNSYIDLCFVHEKDENIRILNIIQAWLKILKNNVDLIISLHYEHPELLNQIKVDFVSLEVDKNTSKFDIVIQNLKFLPILPSMSILSTITNEIIPKIPKDELRIKEIYFKNITDFNFEGTKMKEPVLLEAQKQIIRQQFGVVPKVLSMTVVYNGNPLLWPLILHEYGHVIYKEIKNKDEMKGVISKLNSTFTEIDVKVDDIVSEIFSDLFAINYYGSSYLFAFYFHEILKLDLQKMIGLKDDDKFKFSSHPPSAMRLDYMLKELKKRKDILDDKTLEKLLEYHSPYQEEIDKKRNSCLTETQKQFFITAYEEISRQSDLLDIYPEEKIGLDTNHIELLRKNLIERLPISAIRDIDLQTLKEGKQGAKKDTENEEPFLDLDKRNEIRTIIYVGWKHLIFDILDDFYEKKEKDYLKNLDLKFKQNESEIQKKIKKFSNQYEFLMKTMIYSIETAVVISNYSED